MIQYIWKYIFMKTKWQKYISLWLFSFHEDLPFWYNVNLDIDFPPMQNV